MTPAAKVINSADELSLFIADLLKGITVAQGYETDIGTRVFRGRLKHDEDLIPYCTLVEGEDRVQDEGADKVVIRQEFAVGAYLKCDPDNPNDAAHKAIRDIKQKLFSQGPGPARGRMGNRVKKVTYMGKDIGPRADGKAIVFAVVHLEVLYSENLVSPTT